MPHVFLSNAWLEAVESLLPDLPAPPDRARGVVLDVVVTGAPDGDVRLHARDGVPGRGPAGDAPATLTVPYAVAERLFVDRDPSLVMQALMTGELTVAGDASQVMGLVLGGGGSLGEGSAERAAFLRRVRDLTA